MNNSNLMNSDLQQIPQAEIQFFKERVSRWLNVDSQIDDLQKQIRDLKKVRDKELQPTITEFMVSNNGSSKWTIILTVITFVVVDSYKEIATSGIRCTDYNPRVMALKLRAAGLNGRAARDPRQ